MAAGRCARRIPAKIAKLPELMFGYAAALGRSVMAPRSAAGVDCTEGLAF